MDSADGNSELERLIDSLIEGLIDEAGVEQLNRLLVANEQARLVSGAGVDGLRVVRHPSDPRSRHAGKFAHQQRGRFRAGPPERPAVRARHSTATRPIGWSQRWLAIAASILIACIATGWLTYQGANGTGPLALLGNKPRAANLAGSPTPSKPVATVTGTRDCRWGEDLAGVGFGSSIEAGKTYFLQEGLAEITFKSGARVVLEGPTSFSYRASTKPG